MLAGWTARLRGGALAGPARGQRLRPASREERLRRRPPVRPGPVHPPLVRRRPRAVGARRAPGSARRSARSPWWSRRVWSRPARGQRASPIATLAAVAALVLSAGLVLERWPGRRVAPSFADAMRRPRRGRDARPGRLRERRRAGAARRRGPRPGRASTCWCGRPAPVSSLTVTVGGQGACCRAGAGLPIVLRPTGALVSVPFVPYHDRPRPGRPLRRLRASHGWPSRARPSSGWGEGPPEGAGRARRQRRTAKWNPKRSRESLSQVSG